MPVLEKVIDKIPVAGIQKLTSIDFPDHIAAVLFTSGCPWKCRYCHNPDLRSFSSKYYIPWNSVENFLKSRKGYLDGIVVSGGEPTFHSSLPKFLKYIREIGYKTAIHTNGLYPHMLQMIIKKGLVDKSLISALAILYEYNRSPIIKAKKMPYDEVREYFWNFNRNSLLENIKRMLFHTIRGGIYFNH